MRTEEEVTEVKEVGEVYDVPCHCKEARRADMAIFNHNSKLITKNLRLI